MDFPKDPTNVEARHQKLSSMAIVGHTTCSQCRLWVRVYRKATWWLVVSEKPIPGDLDSLNGMDVNDYLDKVNLKPVFSDSKTISDKTDFTHVFDIPNLRENTRYYYSLIADSKHKNSIARRTEIGNQEKKFFKTLPKTTSRIVFGFYSCHDPFSNISHGDGAWPHYYDTLRDRQALFSIGGGDQVYVDTNDKEDMYSVWKWLARYKNGIIKEYSDEDGLQHERLIDYFSKIYRNYYRVYWNFLNLRKVYEQFPQYMIWDDHEIMDGWGSYTNAERTKLLNRLFQDDKEEINDELVQLMFCAAKRVYLEYQHKHNPKTPTATYADLASNENELLEWDYHFDVAQYHFYVLDMRGHHDYDRRNEGNALLSDLQMERFETWLDKKSASDTRAIFVVSSVPLVHWGPLVSSLDFGSLKDDLRDEWEHDSNTCERNNLLDKVLAKSQSTDCPVVFLSGDVHSASFFQIENHEKYPGARVFSATSSAISRKPAPKKAELFMKKTGRISRYEGGTATRLYAQAGEYNFMMVTAEINEDGLNINVDLHWPAGDEREIGQKRIKLV